MITDIFGPQDSDIILVEGDVYDPANLAGLLALEDAIPIDPRNIPGDDAYFARERINSIADAIVQYSGALPQTREEVENIVAEVSKLKPLDKFVTKTAPRPWSCCVRDIRKPRTR